MPRKRFHSMTNRPLKSVVRKGFDCDGKARQAALEVLDVVRLCLGLSHRTTRIAELFENDSLFLNAYLLESFLRILYGYSDAVIFD